MTHIRQTFFLLIFSFLYAQPAADNMEIEIAKILEGKGVSRAFIRKAFAHDSLKIHAEIVERFANPAENLDYERYRKIFIKDSRIVAGRNFYLDNKDLVDSVSHRYGVEKYLLLSIAGVESNFGENHRSYSVFNAYYTIFHKIPRRSSWAAEQLAEFLEYCYRDSVETQSIHGSYAGAFGYGQFIPGSFNRFAVDFDNDGLRAHDQWPDVLASIANYLVMNGYEKGSVNYAPDSPNWKSIYAYNHSNHYVRVVIELKNEIEKALKDATESG